MLMTHGVVLKVFGRKHQPLILLAFHAAAIMNNVAHPNVTKALGQISIGLMRQAGTITQQSITSLRIITWMLHSWSSSTFCKPFDLNMCLMCMHSYWGPVSGFKGASAADILPP